MTAPPPTSDAPAAASATGDAAILADGRRVIGAFYARDTQGMWDRVGPALARLLVDKPGLDAFREKVEHDLGTETAVVQERVAPRGKSMLYERIARFSRFPRPVQLLIGFEGTRIVAFGVRPVPEEQEPAATTKESYRTHASLRLPFDGEWTVLWGGRRFSENRHVVARGQRFAYDFAIEEQGTTHRHEGTANTDYFCYGKPIVAPGAGRVVDVIDGVAENRPGEMDAEHVTGNHVVLDHGDGEYSILAHLVPGSITVKVGDQVAAGRTLGRCGNSGNSSEPHLHYHVQDSPHFGEGDGLPAQFVDYVADGAPVTRGEPVRGQHVRMR